MAIPENLADQLSDWIAERVKAAGARGAVLGLSGGIDSSVVAALCARALGRNVLGVLLPCNSLSQDAQDALMLAEKLGIETAQIDLAPMYNQFCSALPTGSDLVQANLKPRLRMTALYHFAGVHGYLVLGTGNKTELLIGYFTKYGDGGSDLLPIGGLFKCQVRELARQLQLPQSLIDKPPSAGLWEGQTDEDEIGMTYEQLDSILAALESGQEDSIPDTEAVARVKNMINHTEHKRLTPPTPAAIVSG